ncbi:hypothetical protein ACWKSP_34035 [Micromonosporaceae bacterium Da 78-11]
MIARLDTLLDDLTQAETEHAVAIAAVAPTHRQGAVNLVHYTTLRRRDRRDLQNELMDIGATSLATAEANVAAKVHAAHNVLAALRGDTGPWNLDAITSALDKGDTILNDHSDAIFGPMRPDRPTRIMVTLPSEAADDPGLVASLVDAGMDVARVNCAHDGPAAWERMAANVRAAATGDRSVLISMDLPGPKLRTGPILDGPAVGRARVTRNESGHVLAPAQLWLTPTRSGVCPRAGSSGPASGTRGPGRRIMADRPQFRRCHHPARHPRTRAHVHRHRRRPRRCAGPGPPQHLPGQRGQALVRRRRHDRRRDPARHPAADAGPR